MKALHVIENKIADTIYGYDPAEFFPIFEDGQLANRGTYIAYKARRTMIGIGSLAARTAQGISQAVQQSRME